MASNSITNWSEMSLNYWRIAETCPKSNEVDSSLILGHEIFSLLMEISARWSRATYVPPPENKFFIFISFITTSVVNAIGKTYVVIQGLLESTNKQFR
jgi:hypothetical protein